MYDPKCDNEENDGCLRHHRFVDHRSKEAESFNILLDTNISSKVMRWDCYEHIGWVFELEDVVLNVENTAADTIMIRVTSGSMPRVFIDPLRQQLRQILSTALAGRGGVLDFAVTLLQLVETAVISVGEWKHRGNSVDGRGPKGWDVATVIGQQAIFDNPHGVDLVTIDDSAFYILGKTVKELCEPFQDDSLRILHVENVLRSDLVSRFRRRQNQILDQLMRCNHHQLRQCVPNNTIPCGSALDNRDDLARELCRPRATYHGTSRYNVSSIVRWGFVLPGRKAGDRAVDIAYGSSFGRGIYTSPDPHYALSYSRWSEEFNLFTKTRLEDMPGLRLIICAVLMGRPLQVAREATRRTTEIADKTANSHVSPNLCEYIVFKAAQIIPCYVVHFDFGLEAAREWLQSTPADPNEYKKKKHAKLVKQNLLPGELADLKQDKKAAALKWFPYGYGPATGTSFVIEEIGAVSDDEENYGEYQGQRQEIGDDVAVGENNTIKAGSWFDEYQNSRREEAKIKRARDDYDDGED
jgi:hypothetical protein